LLDRKTVDSVEKLVDLQMIAAFEGVVADRKLVDET